MFSTSKVCGNRSVKINPILNSWKREALNLLLHQNFSNANVWEIEFHLFAQTRKISSVDRIENKNKPHSLSDFQQKESYQRQGPRQFGDTNTQIQCSPPKTNLFFLPVHFFQLCFGFLIPVRVSYRHSTRKIGQAAEVQLDLFWAQRPDEPEGWVNEKLGVGCPRLWPSSPKDQLATKFCPRKSNEEQAKQNTDIYASTLAVKHHTWNIHFPFHVWASSRLWQKYGRCRLTPCSRLWV